MPPAGAGLVRPPRTGSTDWAQTLAARGAGPLEPAHLRLRVPTPRPGTLHCYVLDGSGSMLQGQRLARAKGLLAGLMQRAARRGERVALLCFAGHRVELRVAPSRPGAWRDDWVRPIAGGGGTPITQALQRASALLAADARRHPGDQRCLWLLTDGRTREQPPAPRHAGTVRIVDFDEGPQALGRAARWAAAWGAEHASASDWIAPPEAAER